MVMHFKMNLLCNCLDQQTGPLQCSSQLESLAYSPLLIAQIGVCLCYMPTQRNWFIQPYLDYTGYTKCSFKFAVFETSSKFLPKLL